ncbi:MAG: GIY-YIG nuclease family protein [Caulobacteraceae bacterium]
MDRPARKAAIAAYKERKAAHGVFAVICTATGEAWVGQSRHLDTQQNGLWFALKHGGSPYRSLQASWNVHGADGFRFEELERLRDDFPSLSRPNELKRRQTIWSARLGAIPL